jgi:hypothetical protein
LPIDTYRAPSAHDGRQMIQIAYRGYELNNLRGSRALVRWYKLFMSVVWMIIVNLYGSYELSLIKSQSSYMTG